MRWIPGALIIAHGFVTAMIWAAPAKADAPFQATHSWLIGDARAAGMALAIVAAIGFAAAGVAVLGHQTWWAGFGIAAGGLALVLMVLYFNPWLLAGVAISAAILLAGVQDKTCRRCSGMSYAHDLDFARRALNSRDRNLRGTRYGTIEYADHGEGSPVLACHPLLGGFDIGLRIVDVYLGEGYRAVAPSRFGYLGSSLPDGVTAEDQADAYEALLDALDVRRVTVFGYSAGGEVTPS